MEYCTIPVHFVAIWRHFIRLLFDIGSGVCDLDFNTSVYRNCLCDLFQSRLAWMELSAFLVGRINTTVIHMSPLLSTDLIVAK